MDPRNVHWDPYPRIIKHEVAPNVAFVILPNIIILY